MIDKIDIENFRCFRHLELGGLKRFNIIVGPSGSGKTALLEALFLVAGGSPEIYFRLRRWRGLTGPLQVTGAKASYESIFRELFFKFDPTRTCRISFSDNRTGTRKLEVGFKNDLEYRISLKELGTNAFVVDPIYFRWLTPSGTHDSSIQIKDNQLSFGGTSDVHPVWLISPAAPENLVLHYSELSKRGKSKEIDDLFRAGFPSVKGLSVESAGGDYSIFVDLKEHDGEKIPVGTLSAGINKYLSILIAIASNPNGVVLVDEIESGFYFEILPKLLKDICKFASDKNVQIIATTHSYELLKDFADAMEGREEHFVVMRSSLGQDGEASITMSRGLPPISAIQHNIEIR